MRVCGAELQKRTPDRTLLTRAGLTLTQTWNTANALDTKLEVNDTLAKGLKLEGLFNFLPATAAKGAKFNLLFKQPGFHGRAFFNLLKGPTANVDAVVGHEGFLAGASAGYDVNKAAVTAYSAAVGYAAPQYSAAVTATDNLSIFAASYYHKVNSQVEAGAKATWNSKTGNTVGLEVASKYRIDPVSFAKAKINDRGIAAIAYNVLLREGVTLGLGGSFDTQKLDQATHKVSSFLERITSSILTTSSSVPASPSRVKLSPMSLPKNYGVKVGAMDFMAMYLR